MEENKDTAKPDPCTEYVAQVVAQIKLGGGVTENTKQDIAKLVHAAYRAGQHERIDYGARIIDDLTLRLKMADQNHEAINKKLKDTERELLNIKKVYAYGMGIPVEEIMGKERDLPQPPAAKPRIDPELSAVTEQYTDHDQDAYEGECPCKYCSPGMNVGRKNADWDPSKDWKRRYIHGDFGPSPQPPAAERVATFPNGQKIRYNPNPGQHALHTSDREFTFGGPGTTRPKPYSRRAAVGRIDDECHVTDALRYAVASRHKKPTAPIRLPLMTRIKRWARCFLLTHDWKYDGNFMWTCKQCKKTEGSWM